ncbi:unnamed protein product [Symbiodinium natans]|uniref:EF-hand domain-containing protein n=1 Tax=Symbiodinium natans TaxID=878477 RepID=A0A812RQX5_9DINO|nr:unnamed protein product [Symbiodinium natans]
MGWGRGGRGQGQGRGPRLVSPRPTSPRPASPSSSHYFEEAADETTNQDGSDQITRLEKKLADIKEIEERLKRGETPSISQIKKVESKAAVEKELAQLRGHSEDVDTQLAELLKEKAELEAEQAAEKEGAGQSCFLPHVVPEMTSPSSRAKLVPGQPPRSPTRLAPWAKQEKPRSKSPAVTEPAMKAEDLPTPTSKEQSAAPSSTPPRSRATSPRPEGELSLPLPARVQDWQIRQLREDLCFWSEKYASAARVDSAAVVVQLSAEAHAGGAKAELFALMEYDLELEQGTLSRGIVSISGSPKATGKTINDDLSDVDVVFECCDTDASGELDLHEVKFALNAFGLFPSLDYLRDWMGDCQTLDRTAFRNLLDQKRRSAPTSMRRPRTVPYARRGVRMQQLNDLQHTFLSSGWLKSKCDAFNAENKKAIDAGSCFAMDTNLYALNRWVIMPGTSPSVAEPLPPALRRSAGMPDALHESSYSELMNSGGLAVDYFVSHFWGHPFQDTWSALDLWSQQVHWQIGKEPPDMVYWVCLLALNQHQPGGVRAALLQSPCVLVKHTRLKLLCRLLLPYDLPQHCSMPFGVSFSASSKQKKAEEVDGKSVVPVPSLFTDNKSFKAAFGLVSDPRARDAPKKKSEVPIIIQQSGREEKARASPWGLVSTIMEAYNQHHELVLRPDDVWQAILTQFSFYVNAHAEALRDRFVNFEGKMTLVVSMGGTLFTADYAKFAERMVDENIVKNIKDPGMVAWLIPAFTTTTVNDRVVAAVSVMSTLQNYFEYVCCLMCGIPKVTLLGTVEDWVQLRQKVDRLPDFDLEDRRMSQWVAMLAPVLDQFVASASGKADLDFWDKVCCHLGGGSGPSYLSGWVSVFSVFKKDGAWQGDVGVYRGLFDDEKPPGPWPCVDTDCIPAGTLSVPVLVDDNGTQYDTQMVAGVVVSAGQLASDICCDGRGLCPRTDWCIAYTGKPKAEPRGYQHGEIRPSEAVQG